jgi:membrane associated rhomboid family serine protease
MPFEDMHRPISGAGFRGAVKWIVIVSGVLLVVQQFLPGLLIGLFGLIPSQVVHHYWLWQPVTYLFLHGGVFHWLFNMFILWMFGRELEVRWGTAVFLKYFFICGIGAALCVLALSPHSTTPTIGASGAIFGLLVAFAMIFPEAVLYLYFVVPVKAWQAAILFGFIELFAGMEGGGQGYARFAHLGGMATGYLYLRFEDFFTIRTHGVFRRVGGWFRRMPQPKRKTSIEFHEVTDDLVKEVDRILEKILKSGADSLTSEEKKIMERYSKLKH